MHINRSLLNWGVFLIALGGIPLAVDQGWLQTDIAGDLGQLWPLILVGIGLGLILRWTPLAWFGGALVAATLGVILGATVVSIRDDDFANLQGIIPAIASGACSGGESGSANTSEGGLADSDEFELLVTLSCGELTVARATTASWAVEASHEPGDAPRIETSDGDGATAQLKIDQDVGDELVFLGQQTKSAWDVSLPTAAALRISMTLNAATGDLDLGSGPVARVGGTFNASDGVIDLGSATTTVPASVDLTLNASDGHLLLPAGDVNAGITLNASSLTLCVPEDAALSIDYSSVIGGDDLGSSGLEEVSPGQWTTAGFTDAADRISISLTSTVSSLSIERPEVCS